MNRKKILLSFPIALLLVATISTFVVNVRSNPGLPKLYVDPPTVVENVGCSFTIDIKVSDINSSYGMWGFEFRLTWDSSLLEVEDDPGTEAIEGVTEGSFLRWGGPSPPETTWMSTQLNNNTGNLNIAATILGQPYENAYPATGNGTLVTIKFILVALGSCTLDLLNTHVTVIDPITHDPVETAHTVEDGSFSSGSQCVRICQISHKTIVCRGYPASINVTVRNLGASPEAVDISTYYNSSWILIGTKPVALSSGESQTLDFVWETATVAKGMYLINATVSDITLQISRISDNMIRVTMVGDIAAPWDEVDIVDIVTCAIVFGRESWEPEYNPNADINSDDIIDIVDIVTIAIHFGEVEP